MGGDLPGFSALYDDPARALLLGAARVESAGYGRWARLREVAELARGLGVARLGLACCPDMRGLAEQAAGVLSEQGFEQVLLPEGRSDDPVTQARTFAKGGVELNVIAGLCVVHELAFLQATSTPTVGLFARDRRLAHNPAAALYTSHSYSRGELRGAWPLAERPPVADVAAADLVGRPCGGGQGDGASSRLAELLTVAHGLGVRRVGVAFCVGLREEAGRLVRVLEANGFGVASACCKTGGVPKERAGLRDDEKLRPGRPEAICNPALQARLLDDAGVQLVVLLGLCAGHDAVAMARLETPVVGLVVKDRRLAHNPVAALPR